MIQRERKIDINKLSKVEISILEGQLGGRIRQICDHACDEANKLLNIYGLRCKMQIVIDSPELKKEPVKELSEKKARGRPKKASQSLT